MDDRPGETENGHRDENFLAAVAVGDVLGGTVTAVDGPRHTSVALDGCAGPPSTSPSRR